MTVGASQPARSSAAGPAPAASTLGLIRRLRREMLAPYYRTILLAVLFMLVAAGAQGVLAWLIQPVVDQVLTQKNQQLLWPLSTAVLGTTVVKGCAEYAQAVLMNRVSLRVVADARKRLLAHLLRLDISFFNTQTAGKLTSRFMVDVDQLRYGLTSTLVGLGKNGTTVVALAMVIIYQDWRMAAMTFIAWPIGVGSIVLLGRRIRKTATKAQECAGTLSSLLGQTFQGIPMVKAYALEAHERHEANASIDAVYRMSLKHISLRAFSSPIMELLGGIAVSLCIVYNGSRVINGTTTTGTFFSFLVALMMLYRPLKSVVNLNASLQAGLAGAARLFEILDITPSINDAADAKPLRIAESSVRLEGVDFAYNRGDRQALHHLTLDIPSGKTVALVGLSGSGKSTVMKLIMRLYDVDSGVITIDGQNVRGVTLDSLRSVVGWVQQDATLFDDTVRANIAYGDLTATQKKVEDAAKAASAHGFIQALPNGYDTLVGERGSRLSGGQRQRLEIARAVLKNAPILLLDEATSALDAENEQAVQTALNSLMVNRTTLVIAHRLSTVIRADRIYVMDEGKIVESGTHNDLLVNNGGYARLCALQFSLPETGISA